MIWLDNFDIVPVYLVLFIYYEIPFHLLQSIVGKINRFPKGISGKSILK